MIGRVLVFALLASLLAGSGSYAQDATPWRLGAPEVVWRYPHPARPGIPPHLGTLYVHPGGGVVAVARADREPLNPPFRYGRERITLFRISASGVKLWERTIALDDEDTHWAHVHLAFLHGPRGTDTIVVVSYKSLTVLGPTGAVRWTRSAAQVGITGIGVAIARHTAAGDWIVVGGEGRNDRDEPVAMAAGLTFDGTRRWLAVGPWPADLPSPAPPDANIGNPDQIPTVALPLRILDDGGAVVLTGCGGLGTGVAGDPHDFQMTRRTPNAPCERPSPVALVAIDGSGRTDSVVVAGTVPSAAQSARWNLPPAVWVDTWLAAYEIGQGSGGGWNPRAFPDFVPSVWWFGPSTPAIVRFLDAFQVYRGEPPSPEPPSLAMLDAADVVVEQDVTFLLQAEPYRRAGRLTLLGVRRDGVAVVAARKIKPLQRVRYAPRDNALYALRGNDVVRMRLARHR